MSNNRPNIVLIMTDQQRADLCAREGYPLHTTPFLDELAAGGTWFNRAYSAASVCLPARICMLTGRWAGATRIRHNSVNMQELDPPAPVYTKDVFDVMSEQGYRTALVGKNHSHLTPERADHWVPYGHSGRRQSEDRTEDEIGFDEYLKATHGRGQKEPAPFPLECQLPYRIVRDSMSWIESDKETPFFLWMSIPEPHNPYQACDPYHSMFPADSLPPLRSRPDDWSRRGYKYAQAHWAGEQAFPDYDDQIPYIRSSYHGMLRLIDDQIRRFVTFLDESGLRENTPLVYVSDHGDFVGEYGLVRKGPETPEVLMRVPMFWNWPGVIGGAAAGGSASSEAGSAHPGHVSSIDIFLTLCEAIGVEIPDGVQGRSLWPLLTGDDFPADEFASVYSEHGMGGLHHEERDDVIDPFEDGIGPGVWYDSLNSVNQSGFIRMIRKGKWKLDYDMQGRGQLYNLAEDPVELNNLYGSPETAEIERDLLADLLAWSMRADDPLPLPNGRYKMKTDSRNYWANYR